MDPSSRRNVLMALGGLAVVALLAAVLVVVTAPNATFTFLVACLVVIVAALVGELIVVLATRRDAGPLHHDAHTGPGFGR